MQFLVGLIVFGLLAILVVTGLTAVFRRLNRWNRTYEAVNRRYHGQLVRGYLFSSPRMWFNYGRTVVRLQNRKGWRYPARRATELALQWKAHPSLRFEIRDVSSQPPSRRGWRWGQPASEVKTGQPEFDAAFQVVTNAPEVMQVLLTDAVCWQLMQLKQYGSQRQLEVHLKRGQLRMLKPGWQETPEALDDFVRFALELYDRLQLAECEGIDFRNDGDVALVERVVCPICSEVIVDQMVVCLRCKTPHCLDCWQYNGQCATFACEEKRYVKA